MNMKTDVKKNKALSIKITHLSKSHLEFICDCFVELARFDFRIRFLEWFIKEKCNPDYDENGAEKDAEI